MAYVKHLFKENFLEYASYVIKDRAIPDIVDGLKPVQRRILHSLIEMDDSRFHKVANVVGHCMKYHPHGDASIYSALVVLANKDLFIDKQGNFGNPQTGDPASAARYIECRLLPFAKEILHSPEITEYEDSYDGRNQEPVAFPCKIPLVIVQGAEGIAVGMSTKILPHNLVEVLAAVQAELEGREFALFPDFPNGGFMDASGYEDGMGKVLVRARMDTSDPKKIVIKELPFGQTTESLIGSIEAATRKGKIKVSSIDDYSTESPEIEIKLARGVHTQEVIDSLYAFTDCETSISVNLLVIKDGLPVQMTVTEVIKFHAKQLVGILTDELRVEEQKLLDKLHARTLEQIFIEERIYKKIETKKTQEAVIQAVLKGLEPFQDQIRREVTREDVDRLLKIPIRRISLYDINKAKREMDEISARLKEIAHHLKHIVEYAVDYLEAIKQKTAGDHQRRTEMISFQKVDVREAAVRNQKLYYDNATGYLGYNVKTGKALFEVSTYDRVLVIRKDGTYMVIDVPERQFLGKGMLFCGLTDKEMLEDRVFTLLLQNPKTKQISIKRTKIEKFILGKTYELVPPGLKLVKFTEKQDVDAVLTYIPKPRLKVLEERFFVGDYLVKGVKAGGVRLSTKEVKSAKFLKAPKR